MTSNQSTHAATLPNLPDGPDEGRRAWFAHLVEKSVMPLLKRGADELGARGCQATARVRERDGRLFAELEAVPPGLPAGARPPLMTVTAARPPRDAAVSTTKDRPLLVEFTGTYPAVGATGGFGAEAEYDTIGSNQLEEKIVAFVDLAAGG